jgi:predicted deacetylase
LRVHVSIHDVAPAFQRELELALEMARADESKPALLVVPNYHGETPLDRAPSFCALLRGLQADGHEIYLHGFFHKCGLPPLSQSARGASVTASRRRSPLGRASRRRGEIEAHLAQRVVSAGEAECSGLTRDEAAARLDAGERALREVGLAIDGFVPPAWWLPKWLVPILAARGYAYTEDRFRVYCPVRGRARASLVLNYASRSPWRLASSIAFCRLATPLATRLPARIAIHPADMRFAVLRREVRRLLSWGRGQFVSRASELLLEERVDGG